MIVIGGDGKLGSALCEFLRATGQKVLYTSRRTYETELGAPGWVYLDMLYPLLPREHLETSWHGVPIMFIVAAVTGIAQCESDPDTWRVNADAPVLLTGQARPLGWHVVFVSSSAVETAPHTAYAMQKAHAELGVLAMGGTVFRPARIATHRYKEAAEALATKCMQSRQIIRWE